MPIKLIWRLRRKQQIKKIYLRDEAKQKSKILSAKIGARYNELLGLKPVIK